MARIAFRVAQTLVCDELIATNNHRLKSVPQRLFAPPLGLSYLGDDLTKLAKAMFLVRDE
jgi:hypothetical protein